MVEDNTLWYDKVLNETLQNNASPKLETSLQEGEETKTQTTSDEGTKRSTQTLQEPPHDPA